MEPMVYVDGEMYPKSEAKISVFDHGLLYGDGIFEGIRVYSGRIFRFKEHMDRLFESARCLAQQQKKRHPHRPQGDATMVVMQTRQTCFQAGPNQLRNATYQGMAVFRPCKIV